eukprot:CAMPEP_0169087996 /NCGR_PEP_ID=MMETSP1015-20121227/14523_1 /TAXON_ID=342587 /ORGANISM="Karlodinium micrum, Strain CCMP2283" /LENGTH=624 /DNA_ID=CAMNT_0009148251 /DNA_START=193 /DNA_END=2068 /DNA_ORIENTATION=-
MNMGEPSGDSLSCQALEFVMPSELASMSPEMRQLFSWVHHEVVGRLSRLDEKIGRLSTYIEGSTSFIKEPKYGSSKTPSTRSSPEKIGQASLEATRVDAQGVPVTPRRLPTLLQPPLFQKISDERKPSQEVGSRPQPCDEKQTTLDKPASSPPCEVNLCQDAALRLPSGDSMEHNIDEDVGDTPNVCPNWSLAVGVQEDACSNGQVSMRTSVASQQSRRPSINSIASQKDLAALVQSRVGWQWREQAWTFLDDVESSRAAAKYLNGVVCFTLLSVALSLAQAVETPPFRGEVGFVAEVFFESSFLLEFLLRLFLCPDRWMFFRNIHNVCDLAAISPLALRIAVGINPRKSGNTLACNVLISVVPVLRVLKTLRAFKHFHLIVRALATCLEALPICLFSMFVLTLAFAAAIFMVEPRENIHSLHHAMWLTIVTMTTLGYGDVLPSTTAGSLVVAVLVVSSVMYMAMPLAIIGQAFSEVWRDRDRILLVHGVGSRLLHWGYKATDIPALFQVFDEDDSGELRFPEFKQMIEEMHIGLSEIRILHLFESIDGDGSGSIDDKEFVNALFPQYFKQIYEDDECSEPCIEPQSPLSPLSKKTNEAVEDLADITRQVESHTLDEASEESGM